MKNKGSFPLTAGHYLMMAIWMTIALTIVTPVAAKQVKIWIDTDPACGHSETSDVDDCLAILQALRSPSLEIVGISTVFGNESGKITWEIANRLFDRFREDPSLNNHLPPLYRGADRPSQKDTEGVRALIRALKADPLTVIAIGPLTNVAAALKTYPGLSDRINGVIAVGGTRKETWRFWPGDSRILHFHDLNFIKDVDAFETIITSGVPLHLMPFEAANHVTVTRLDMAALKSSTNAAAWIAQQSEGWIRFWEEKLDRKGFCPFDSLAVGYLTAPDFFTCEISSVRVVRRRGRFKKRDTLEVSDSFTDGTPVTYCHTASEMYTDHLISTLIGTKGRNNQQSPHRSPEKEND